MAFGFTKNTSLWQKLIKTLYFLALKPYSGLVMHYGHVHKLLWIFLKRN
jgi:hypothetical protein